MAAGIIDIVEGAYDTDLDGQAWLVQANERFARRFAGVVACGGHITSRTAEGQPVFHNACLTGVDDAMTVFGPLHANMTPEFAEAIFPAGTQCVSFNEHWSRVRLRSWDDGVLEMIRSLQDYFRLRGGDDMLASYSYDHTGTGVLLSAVVKGTKITQATRELHRRAAVHVASGLRLRWRLAKETPDEPREAIFESDGRLAHAEGRAEEAPMRAQLREAVKRIDRARTASVRKRELDALELWQGLVEGRWSLIDRYDTDGRRYYVAIANPPEGVTDRKLSEVEAHIVALVTAGEPNGVIAYSLGLAESTVAGHLSVAMRKLGAASRMEVVRLGRALGALPEAAAEPATLEA